MINLYETADAAGVKILVRAKGNVFNVLVAVVGGYYPFITKKTLKGAITAANKLAL